MSEHPLEKLQKNKKLMEWLSPQIKIALQDLAETKKAFPNSYGHGYDAGYLQALRDVGIAAINDFEEE